METVKLIWTAPGPRDQHGTERSFPQHLFSQARVTYGIFYNSAFPAGVTEFTSLNLDPSHSAFGCTPHERPCPPSLAPLGSSSLCCQEGIAPALALHEPVVSCLINELFDIIFSFCTCPLLYSAHMYCNVSIMDPLRYQSCQSDTEIPTQMVPKLAEKY